MNNYAVLFDMDGVIANTNPYHSQAFEHFFDKYQVPYTQADFEQHMYGKHNSYIMSHFFNRPIHGKELEDLENEKEGLFREIYKTQVKPITGLIAFLEQLHTNGYKLAVATAAPKANMDLIVDALDIRKYMSSLLCSENVTKHKPDPEVYLKSAHVLGIPTDNCIVFEDSFSGVMAAKNAEMKVVGVLSSHSRTELPPCDFYIDDYRGLYMPTFGDLQILKG
ncbi:HAD family hydrolase [Sphingobacterium sp. Mn56C]|uniref:HAD family hydrolase n=1 Tax=Sphingobacterium sp. Mn56C TaxID=3395261 RepID=UPI003BE1A920